MSNHKGEIKSVQRVVIQRGGIFYLLEKVKGGCEDRLMLSFGPNRDSLRNTTEHDHIWLCKDDLSDLVETARVQHGLDLVALMKKEAEQER